MSKLKKWLKKLKIYKPLKIEIRKYTLREESKYRLTLYKLLIYKVIIYKDDTYKLFFYYQDNRKRYIIWYNSLKVLQLIKKEMKKDLPITKGRRLKNKIKNYKERSLIVEIYNINKNNKNEINIKYYNINFIFEVDNIIDLLYWINYVDIDIMDYKGRIFETFENIKRYQKNCKDINYYYDSINFNNNLYLILNDLKYILTNYKFII